MRYAKPALTFEQQIDLLQGRGLAIPDRPRAKHWLGHISYYRLSAYLLPFKDGDTFRPGTTFDSVAGLYIFDRKLRLILLDAIERVEVALRTCLTYELSHAHGVFGHTDSRNFEPRFRHDRFMEQLAKAEADSKETFVSHYRRKYTSERHLPVWMATELLSLGQLSRLYEASHPNVKRAFARDLNAGDRVVASWLHTLSYVRNVCAHHSRLWNRELAIKPVLPRLTPAWPYRVPSNERLYCVLVILRHTLMRISPRCLWHERLLALFDGHPEVSLDAMQIPADWRTAPLWVDAPRA
jgi:abortive infection bacteriophage resistance protein